MSYQDTSLWKRTLGKKDKNVTPLRKSFLDARKNAEFLLGKIRKDFPNLTVHDITHVDSLWNVADTIIGNKYPINPLEAYILGIAFLIHDAALSYDTVGGMNKLQKTIEWQDAYADGPGDKDEAEFEKECDFAAIRAIHAKEAEKILFQLFTKDNGSTFYIIDNDSYRNHFGSLIGKIAASHHWDIDKVESELKKQINPRSEMPNDWKINAQKLACILRCADAGHIDDGRAPDAIYQSLLVNGVSRHHWESQNHLCQVCEDDENSKLLCITSISPFEKKDFDAWNVAYDAIRLFDEELKKSNHLLESINPDLAFPHIGVSGASSKECLSLYVETEGWQPCNFGVHTSNIKMLIENLGGSKLYGKDNMILVVLRELIQNARDAIHARQKMDDSFDNGKITVRLITKGKNRIIEVEDNGIGMSMDCIKNHLLDFGSSYWKSSLSKYENPGLSGSGFTSVGKFGIGFYSVFMVAKSVEVITKRYKDGVDDAQRVEFPEGLTLSPIISICNLSSLKSTIVRFKLKKDIKIESSIKTFYKTLVDEIPLSKSLSLIVAGLDCDVYFQDECIHQNINSRDFDKTKWFKNLCIKSSVKYSSHLDMIARSLDEIRDSNDNIRGLICLDSNDYDEELLLPSVVTVGGLLAYKNDSFSSFEDLIHYNTSLYDSGYGFIGYLDCKENSISRDSVYIDKPLKKTLFKWFEKHYRKNYNRIIQSDKLAEQSELFIYRTGLEISLFVDLIKQNVKEIYTKHMRELLDNNSINVLTTIHKYSTAGIISYDSRYKDNTTKKSEIIKGFEQMPESEYNEIVSKYLYIVFHKPFYLGTNIVARLWLNLKLKSSTINKMIDWRFIDFEEYIKIERFKDNNKLDLLCNFLESYLVDGNEDVFSSCIFKKDW